MWSVSTILNWASPRYSALVGLGFSPGLEGFFFRALQMIRRCSSHTEDMTVFLEECLLCPLVVKISRAGSPEVKVSGFCRTLITGCGEGREGRTGDLGGGRHEDLLPPQLPPLPPGLHLLQPPSPPVSLVNRTRPALLLLFPSLAPGCK